jgi:hypothetical protein
VEIRSGEKVGGGSLLLVVHCRRPMEVGARRAAEQGCHGHGCLAAQRRDVGAASSTLCASRETQERPPHAGGRRMRRRSRAGGGVGAWEAGPGLAAVSERVRRRSVVGVGSKLARDGFVFREASRGGIN